MTGRIVAYGAAAPMQGHRGYIGGGMNRVQPARPVRPGNYQRITGPVDFYVTDNTEEALRALRRRDLYAHCERAPWGWENRL